MTEQKRTWNASVNICLVKWQANIVFLTYLKRKNEVILSIKNCNEIEKLNMITRMEHFMNIEQI